LPSLEEMVEDGLLVSRAALRMKMKNLMLVRAAGMHIDFDETWFSASFRGTCVALAAEKMSDAQRLNALRELSAGRAGRPKHPSDYRQNDTAILERRHDALVVVARELMAMGNDPAVTAEILREAREAAFAELADTASRDWAARPERLDSDYDAERDERIASLRADLLTEVEQARGGGSDSID
jgi:predicted ArsR family transcriptional regulator